MLNAIAWMILLACDCMAPFQQTNMGGNTDQCLLLRTMVSAE